MTSVAETRERLNVDIVCVGAGIATLSTVYHLLRRLREEEPERSSPSVLIIEKGRRPGSHVLSGAIMDPAPLRRLLGDEMMAKRPSSQRVVKEQILHLRPGRAWKLPMVPPPMQSKGYELVSLSELTAWLAGEVENLGAEILTELSAVELLRDGDRVVGVRLGDHGIARNGQMRANFMPGADIHARVTVLGEGACGCLAEELSRDRSPNDFRNPQNYALGLKELVKVPRDVKRVGHVMHTFGYPLARNEYGGGFLYHLDEEHVAVGYVVALDYRDPMKNAHDLFLAYKQHPAIRSHLEGGQVLCYGAKLLPEGGYYALPDPVADGVLMTGDCAGLLDAVRLKGIDLAVESGLAAGETLLEACRKDDWSAGSLSRYSERLQAAAGMQRLWRYRNVRAAFQRSMLRGMMTIGLSWLTRGQWPTGRLVAHSDHDLRPVSADQAMPTVAAGGTVSSDPLKVDILSDVFFSGTEHEEDQPCHIDIQDQKQWEQVSAEQYGMPLARCCPGRVYAWDAEKQVLQLEPANCLHCRTCQVKDPLQAVRWRPPEGGGGPRYQRM